MVQHLLKCVRSCPAGGRRHMRSLHGEQFTRPQVRIKSNKHEHGEPDKLVESKLLGHPAKAAEGHWINVELSCPLRPPAERPGRARKFVLAVAIFIGAMVQVPVEAIPALCGNSASKKRSVKYLVMAMSTEANVARGSCRRLLQHLKTMTAVRYIRAVA